MLQTLLLTYVGVGVVLALLFYLHAVGDDIYGAMSGRGKDKFGWNYKSQFIWICVGLIACPLVNVYVLYMILRHRQMMEDLRK